MGILSLFQNLNLGFGMPHIPTTTSASMMEAKEYKEVEHDNKMSLAGDHNEITGVDKDKIFRNDEVSYHDLKRVSIDYPPKSSVPDCPYHLQTGFCTIGMDCKVNHPSREENVEGKLEEAVSGLRSLAKFKGDQGLGHIASSENVGLIECKFYLLPGGCKYGNECGFLHHVELNFLGLPIRPGEKKCPFYMRNGGCKFASRCRFHHPDPTAVVGHSFQDRKNGVPFQDHGPVEQLCETSGPSEKTSNEQTAYLGPFTPNWGLQQNVHWNGNQTTTSPLHPREMNINDQRTTLANKHIAYEFIGGVELQQFEEYPQMPSEPECQYFMKTGYCKFKSACRYHHPKSNVSFLGLSKRPVSNNHQHRGPVEQLSETPSVNTSNEQTGFLGPSSSYVPDLFTPNQGLKQNAQWNEHQTVTSLLHPPEIKKIDEQQALANKDAAYEFSGGEPQQFDEYPQRPGKPECQYFMKTGYCKFNSTCRYHHPKSNLSSLSLPLRPVRNNYEQDGLVEQICEIPLPSENSSNDQSTFLCLSSSNVPNLFTVSQGLQPNLQWNGDQTVTSLLHTPKIKKFDEQQALANKDAAYEFSGGEPQQFDEYPQRPGKPECQYFMKTGYCKFNSACRYHHPKSNLSSLSLPLRPARNNYVQDGLVEQICEIPLPSENSSNDQSTFLCLSSSNVPDLFTPNQGLQPNVQWNGDQTVTSLLHPPEIKKIDQQQELANKDAAYEFSGGEPQQFDEYPQRPGKPECQYFMKTGYCKFNSACRYHHPKSNLSSLSLPLKSARNNYEQDGLVEQICEIPLPSGNSSNDQSTFLCLSSSNVPVLFTPNQGLQPNVQWNGDQIATDPLHPPEIKMIEKNQELAYNDRAYEFNGGVKSQQFDEYPQRPGEPECQYFMQTGYCKFKSACRCHHPKSNLSFLSPPLKPDKPVCTYYSRRGICKFGSACRYNHHMDHT